MLFSKSIEDALLEQDAPIITFYEFFLLGLSLFRKGEWAGEKLKRMPNDWDVDRARNALRRLENNQVLALDRDFKSNVWKVVQSTRSGAAEEIACIADPFCYVSHLSAMERYGLTNRSPQALHLTTPANALWRAKRDEKMNSDLGGQGGDYSSHLAPLLVRPGIQDQVRRRPVIVHETKHPAEAVPVRGERTRISSIGRTFVDMLSEPNLCGGMTHVLEVWSDHAERWAEKIIESTDHSHSKIVKVRAGYIFNDVLRIENPKIDGWKEFAQRGGSRKLDPEAEYAPTFSEKWMISINV